MTLVNSLSISPIVSELASPSTVLATLISTRQINKGLLLTQPSAFDIVTGKFRHLFHHFEHSRDDLLQDFHLFADDLIYHLVCQRQNALQPIQNARWNLVVFVLFLQELNGQALLLHLIRQWRARTSNVTLATPKTAFAIGFN